MAWSKYIHIYINMVIHIHVSLFFIRYVFNEYASRQQETTARALVEMWGVEMNSIPVWTLPAAIAVMGAKSRWLHFPLAPGHIREVDLFGLPRPRRGSSVSFFDDATIDSCLQPCRLHFIADFIVGHAADILRCANPDLVEETRTSLQFHVKCLRETAERLQAPSGSNTWWYTAKQLVTSLLLASQLRNAAHCSTVAELSLRICFPAFRDHLRSIVSTRKFPKASTLCWHQLTLDVAFMRLQARAESPSLKMLGRLRDPRVISKHSGLHFRVAHVDASPYRGREVLLQESVSVSVAQLLDAVAAMKQIAHANISPCELQSMDAAELQRVRALHATMRSTIQRHVHPPAFLATRELNLQVKCQAFLHSVSLETSDIDSLIGWIATLGAFTVDMGTEKGIGLMPKVPISQVLQSWRFSSPLIMEDVGGGDGHGALDGDGADNAIHGSGCMEDNFFEWAVVIPGMMHVLHNLSENLMANLQVWKHIDKRLHAASRVLSSHNNLVRLKRTCFEGMDDLFHQYFSIVPQLVEWRWGSIIRTLRALLAMQAPLRARWNLHMYARGSGDARPLDLEPSAAAAAAGEEGNEEASKQQQERMAMAQDLKLADTAFRDPNFWAALQILEEQKTPNKTNNKK